MTTPFWPSAVSAAGVDPHVPTLWVAPSNRWWLGKPGVMMVELPAPSPDYTPSVSSGEVEHGLSGGGSATTRLGSPARRWSLPFTHLTGRDWQVVQSFYRRLPPVGPGPWCFMPPEDVNRLTPAQSMCGALTGTAQGWVSDGVAPTYSPDTVSPVLPCGVLSWVSGGINHLLTPGVTVGVPDVGSSAPYLPGMPVTFSVLARAAGGTPGVKVRLSGRAADGAVVLETTSAAVGLTSTGWTSVSVSAAPGALGAAAYVVPEVVANTNSTYLIACPQLEYASAPSDWSLGAGVPRVTWPAPLGDRGVDVFRTSTVTMTLAEAFPQ